MRSAVSSYTIMFWRKKRHLRKSILEESELMAEVRRTLDEPHIPASVRDSLEKKWTHIVAHLNKIAPRAPIVWRELLMRLGIALGVLIVVLVPMGLYVKVTYFSTRLATSGTPVEGEGRVFEVIPYERAEVSPAPFVRQMSRRGEAIEVMRTDDLLGAVVAVIPEGDGFSVYYTRKDGDGLSLFRRHAVDEYLRSQLAEERVFAVGNLIDASITRDKEGGYLVFYLTGGEKNGEELFLGRFDQQWKQAGEPLPVPRLTEHESGIGLQIVLALSEVENGGVSYYLLTTEYFGDNASIEHKTAPIIRLLDAEFQVKKQMVLDTDKVTLDYRSSLAPLPDGGLVVVSNGRDPLAVSEFKKGDEIYLLEYTAAWKLRRVVQLTNNGWPHDFWPTAALYEKGLLYVPWSSIDQLSQYEGHDTGYPPDAGKIFLGAFQDRLAVGTIFVADYIARPPDGERKEGGLNPHLARLGNRFFIAYDAHIEEDLLDPGDGSYRLVKFEWFDLSTP